MTDLQKILEIKERRIGKSTTMLNIWKFDFNQTGFHLKCSVDKNAALNVVNETYFHLFAVSF